MHELLNLAGRLVLILSSIVIMCAAILIALFFIISPQKVVRDDGTHIAVFGQARVMDEVKGLVVLFTDLKIIALIPGIFVAEMNLVCPLFAAPICALAHTAIQALLSSINGYYFNLRTRSLNNVLFQFIMMPCPLLLAAVMDTNYIKSRRVRGMIGAAIMGSICLATNAGLAAWITYNDVNRQTNKPPGVDWTDGAFGAGFVLYLLSGKSYISSSIL